MGAGFNDGPRAKLTPYQMLLVAGMLCTGCVNILVKKYTYETSSEGTKLSCFQVWAIDFHVFVCLWLGLAGLHGVVHKFQKVRKLSMWFARSWPNCLVRFCAALDNDLGDVLGRIPEPPVFPRADQACQTDKPT